MKFIRGIILCFILFVTILINIDDAYSTNVKRRESLMEYMNNFFSDLNEEQPKRHIRHFNNPEESNKRFRFKEREGYQQDTQPNADTQGTNTTSEIQAPTTNSTNTDPQDNRLIKTKERQSTTDIVLSEWFMISSKAFNNPTKFPPIKLNDNSFVTINVDPNNFRINDANDKQENQDKLPSNKFFWFRLSGLNIYYSSTKTDINILGGISIDSLSNVVTTGTDASTEYITTCFTVADKIRDEWKLCGLNESTVKQWYCQIKTFLKEEDLVNCPVKDPNTNVIEKTINITQPIVIIPLPSRQCNQGWNYQKEGEDWECDCAEGKEQAPIDLPDKKDAIDSSVRPLFQYEIIEAGKVKSTFDGANEQGKLRIELKENLLRIFHSKFGKIITMDGAIYYAEEIVFHTPSEHTVNGKKYDMEIQIIHYGQTKGDIAKQIILSFLFENNPGQYNQFFEELNFFDLPNPITPSKEIDGKIFIPNLFKLSQDDEVSSMPPFSFYTYQGSITFPPCTEDTIMYVSSQVLPIGSTALQLFQEALRIPDMMDNKGNVIVSDWIPKSNRKIQPLNGRPVFHYNHEVNCPTPPKAPKVEVGHYEKIKKSVTNYYYVSGNDPSGLPNSFVVAEDEALGKGNSPNPKKRNS